MSFDDSQSPRYDLAVVGLGYVGLPLALAATASGLRVVGIDVSKKLVGDLAMGLSHVDDVSDQDVASALGTGFRPSTDVAQIKHADATLICVPTPLTDDLPDLRAVEAATLSVAEGLASGDLVVLESTSYPGTTEEVIVPILEEVSGLVAGRDFYVAYSPERIDPGNKMWTLKNTPKVIGGINPASTERAAALYRKFCDEVVTVTSSGVAEMAKLLENTYRHVNIALVNEMAVFCHDLGIDINEVIRAAASKPFGFQTFFPGPGVGGHCIPIDPNYLSFKVRQLGYPFRFVELAQEINARMPSYVGMRAGDLLNERGMSLNGARILLVGVAYKANISDTRETPARGVVAYLVSRGARVSFCDPLVESFEVHGEELRRFQDPLEGAAWADLMIILAPHEILDLSAMAEVAVETLDTRAALPPDQARRL
jgi:nucleotide sugar dehydrogenase